jgi:hypothetical protein
MLSTYTLKIKGDELSKEYLLKRNKEIISASGGIAVFHIVLAISLAIISVILNWNEYIAGLWTGRLIGICLQIMLVVIGHKFPLKTAPYHGALIVLIHLTMLIWKTGHSLENFPKNAMPASVAGIYITIMFGLLTSGNWIPTAISIFIVVIITLIYYNIEYAYTDYVTISLLAVTLFLLTFTLYKTEQRDKKEFIFFKQIM